jgi:hypothetical protein
LATDAAKSESSAVSIVVTTTGRNLEGPYTRFDTVTVEQRLETTLQGKTLYIDGLAGQNSLFSLGKVQTAAGGPGTFVTIRGYVTDQLAAKVRQPGYIQRLADVVSGRLGGQWTARLEASGSRTYLVLERIP